MAKAPKAPGANGPSDVTDVIVRLESVLAAVGDGYWRAHVVRHSLGPIARLTGDGRARLLLAHLGGHAVFVAPALGALAEGLARRGDRDDAARAIAEAEAIVRDAGLDGEAATHAWCALARAQHSLGDAAACDRALDAARDCATRERDNPTQPWPHLAMALADTGRAEALRALLGARPPEESLSFDLEKATRRTVARAVSEGDETTFGRYVDLLQAHNGFVLAAALQEGAAGALDAGRTGALTAIVTRFAAHPSYGAYVGAHVARQAAWHGDVALALRLAALVHAHHPHPSPELAYALRDLGDAETAAQMLARCPWAKPYPAATREELVAHLRTLHAVDPAAAQAAFAAQESVAQAAQGMAQVEHLTALGLARFATREAAYGRALLTQAVTVLLGVSKAGGGYARGEMVKQLGIRAAEAGHTEAALTLLRKSTSKYEKQVIARPLATAYARAGDFAGALAVTAMAPNDTLHTAMALCDLVAEPAGFARAYTHYA